MCSSAVEQVRAVSDYSARHDDELSFNKGAIIDVIGKEDPCWWEGRLGKRVGVFLANFVEALPDPNLEAGSTIGPIRELLSGESNSSSSSR